MKYILILILLWLLARCVSFIEPSRAVVISGDFFVSTTVGAETRCGKETCALSLAHDEIMLSSKEHNLIINDFELNLNGYGIGKGLDGKDWEVEVTNMQRTPYLLFLSTDTLTVVVGYKCH